MIRIKVKEIARQKGLSQMRLAFIADVNMKTVQSIYQHPTETNITLYTLDKLAKALGVNASELIESVYEEEGG